MKLNDMKAPLKTRQNGLWKGKKMKEELCKTKFLNLMAAKRDGKPDWVYAHRPNATDIAVIVPVLHKKEGDFTIFLLTKRPPIIEEYGEKLCVEFPAGLVGDEKADETLDEALRKELLEETGYEAESFRVLAENLVTSGGMTSEKSTLAMAEITDTKMKAEPVDDGGVIYSRVEVKISEISKFLAECRKKEYFLSAQTLSGLYFLASEGR